MPVAMNGKQMNRQTPPAGSNPAAPKPHPRFRVQLELHRKLRLEGLINSTRSKFDKNHCTKVDKKNIIFPLIKDTLSVLIVREEL